GGQHDRGEVEPFRRVDTGGGTVEVLVLGGVGIWGGATRAGKDRVLRRCSGLRDELRVIGAVRGNECRGNPSVPELRDERRRFGVVAGIEDRVWLGPLDQLDRGGEVLVATLHLGRAARVRRGTEGA